MYLNSSFAKSNPNDDKFNVSGPVKKKRKSVKIRRNNKFKLSQIKKSRYSFNLKKYTSIINNNQIKNQEKFNTNKINNNNIFLINNVSGSSERYKLSPELSFKSSIDKGLYSKAQILDNKKNEINLYKKQDSGLDMKEYLETEFDEMPFEDVLEKDKRKFCNYFYDKLKSNLIIIDTFYNLDPFRPRAIKILLLILDLDLYLFINALFINDDFVSDIFHSTKKEKFFSFLTRCFDRIFYTTLVGVIVNNIIECFFLQDKKIKGILKRGKCDLLIIKYKVFKEFKSHLKKYFYFIIISFIITIFTLYYISCFNNIYPHMKVEWIKSSIFILIVMQFFSIFITFCESAFRYLSFLLNSEKLYKISLFLS